jgi:predicted transcriptional regulator
LRNPLLIFLPYAFLAAQLALGCATESATDGATLSLHLTDAPADYERVDVTISRIAVHREGTSRWVTVLDKAQTIDLMSLRDGVERHLQSLNIEPGTYDEFAIDVGDVAVTQRGQSVSLSLLETRASVSYPFEIRGGDDLMVLLDFDAQASLRADADGRIVFVPQLKVKREARK